MNITVVEELLDPQQQGLINTFSTLVLHATDPAARRRCQDYLQHGLDIHRTCDLHTRFYSMGGSALLIAVHGRDIAMVRDLLEYGVSTEVIDDVRVSLLLCN